MVGAPKHRTLKIILIVISCVAALGLVAGATVAGLVESKRSSGGLEAGATPQPTAVASLQVVRPTADGNATVRPAPAPTSAPSRPVPGPMAYVPEVIETVRAPVPPAQPLQQQTAPTGKQTVCPSGVVESGLTDITVTNERYTTVAGVSTMVDVLGHGLIQNRTTAPMYIFNGAPAVRGLDVNGRVTIYLDSDFDWKPVPGEPRPAQILLQPGQNLTYTVQRRELSTETLHATTAWHVNPEDSVDYYADVQAYVGCPEVSVVALPGGPAIMNTYIPWGP